MAEIFRLPAVSPTMEAGTIEGWSRAVGDRLAAGDALVEVGTDKATVEAQVFEEGVLLVRLVDEGAEVKVGAPIAILGEQGEDVGALEAEARAELAGGSAPASTTEAPAEAPPARPPAEAPPTETEPPPPVAAAPTPRAAPPAPLPTPSAPPREATAPAPTLHRTWQGSRLAPVFLDPPGDAGLAATAVRASPLARRLASQHGVDLAGLRGSGPHGRILREDVERATRGGAPAGPAPQAERLKLTPMRRTIAKRLTEVHTTVPTFFLTVTFDVDALVTLRGALKEAQPDLRISYNDLVLLAVARAVAESPAVNTSWGDGVLERHGRVDLGLAVAVEDGLLTPVIRDAARKRLPELAREARELASKARNGTLQPEEWQGNTFTVSNLGMFGIEHFTAILNPPASAILAVGAVEQVPVVRDGVLGTGWRMKATLTCDHRVIDGATGAAFLQLLRRYVEAPGVALL